MFEASRPVLCVECELEYLVAAERGHENEFVALVDADRVGVTTHRYHLERLGATLPSGFTALTLIRFAPYDAPNK